jgi:hypothetical protein
MVMRVATFILSISVFCGCRSYQDRSYTHYFEKFDVRIGETVGRGGRKPFSKITVKEIDYPGARAFLEIIGPSGTDSGWVSKTNHVDFSPQNGTHGIYLENVFPKHVKLLFKW